MLATLLLLALLLGPAMKSDLASRRIPNVLILGSLLTSLLFALMGWNGLTAGALAGFRHWGLGLLVGFGTFLPLYVFRAMGAGDVKLMAACGACLGPSLAWPAALAALMLGGLMALAWVVWRDLPNSVLFPHFGAVWMRINAMMGRLLLKSPEGSVDKAPGPDSTTPTPLEKTAEKLPFSVAIAGASLSAICLSF